LWLGVCPYRGFGRQLRPPILDGSCQVGASPDDGMGTDGHNAAMGPRVLIVDDHEGFRSVARLTLEADGFEVVGEAADAESAVDAVTGLRPDVVLVDVHLPGADGFAVSRLLAALPTPPTVLLISSRPIADLRRRVAESPAAGFLAKHELSGAAIDAMLR
jgi:DNA-binding NarL/FixJ family response regulator